MSGALAATIRSRAVAGAIDGSAMTADDIVSTGSTAYAEAEFYAEGSVLLRGNGGTSPASPRWWTNSSPPSVWMSFTTSGNGLITNGLSAGTIYSVPTLTLGIYRSFVGVASRTFNISFWADAGGTILLGTKTFVATVEVA